MIHVATCTTVTFAPATSNSDPSGLFSLGCNPSCRACSHRAFPYPDSLEQKLQWLRKTLRRWEDRIRPVEPASPSERYHYRRKVCLSAAWDGKEWLIGIRSGDAVIPIHECPVHAGMVNSAIAVLRPVLPPPSQFPLAYFVQSGAIVTLVVKTKLLPGLSWLSRSIEAGLEKAGVAGLWLHLHPSAGNRVFLKHEWRLVWGKGESKDPDGLAYGPVSFQQQIPGLHGRSLDAAADFLAPSPDSVVTDLYCGSGRSLRRWVQIGAQTIGVELSGEAVAAAKENAPGATVLRGKCMERIPQIGQFLTEYGQNRERLLYVNPPRTGLEEQVTGWITGSYLPMRVAYLSCNPATLARDLELIERAGYRLDSMIPFDFFPFTRHVECLALSAHH